MLSPNSNILGINQFLSDILSNLAQRTMFVVMRPGTNLDQVWQHCPLLLVVWPFSFPIYKTMQMQTNVEQMNVVVRSLSRKHDCVGGCGNGTTHKSVHIAETRQTNVLVNFAIGDIKRIRTSVCYLVQNIVFSITFHVVLKTVQKTCENKTSLVPFLYPDFCLLVYLD